MSARKRGKARPAGKRRGARKPPARRRRALGRVALALGALLLVVGAGYTAWLDWRITSAFEGKRWAVPARVYARPLELYEGLHISRAGLLAELEAADYRRADRPERPGQFRRRGGRFLIYTRSFAFEDRREPARRLVVSLRDGEVKHLRVADAQRSLVLARLDPAHIGNIYPGRQEDRILVRLDQVPRRLVEALIAVEDHRFLEHWGVSFTGIGRAMIANLRAGRVVQGGSTLTQQLVKNFFLTDERSLWRKANEALMAVLLELHYDKREILEAYLNEVYLGQAGERSINGFGVASRFYFGAPLERLNLAEQALLVALVRGPSFYDPRRHPQRASERRNLVLEVMAERGYIRADAAAKAQDQPLGVTESPSSARTDYPAFMDLVRRHLRRDYRESDLSSEGLRVITTLAPSVQQAAEAAVAERLARWSDGIEAAAVAVNADSGEVEAIVGGRDRGFAGFNRALDARRPIGSLIKPAVYLSALMRPARYGLGTLLDDQPVTLRDANGGTWTPRNYDKERHGRVPLWEALAHSYNVPTVRLGLDVGLRAVADTLERLGGEAPETLYPSMLLGAIERSPLQVARWYETLATGGFRTPLRAVRTVMTADDQVLTRYPLSVERAFDAGPVYLLNSALQRAAAEGTGSHLSRWIDPALGVAGKTGTTDGERDSWFAGFSGGRLGVVWVGRDDNSRTGLTGSSGALTIWGEMFGRLSLRPLALEPPGGVRPVWIERSSGRLASATCRNAMRLPYIDGSAPSRRADCARRSPAKEGSSGWFSGWFD